MKSVAKASSATPASFSIDSYLERAFDQATSPHTYNIIIRFTPYQPQCIWEGWWHPTRQIEEHDDGPLTLTLNVGALDAVKGRVLRYGEQAEVLEK